MAPSRYHTVVLCSFFNFLFGVFFGLSFVQLSGIAHNVILSQCCVDCSHVEGKDEYLRLMVPAEVRQRYGSSAMQSIIKMHTTVK